MTPLALLPDTGHAGNVLASRGRDSKFGRCDEGSRIRSGADRQGMLQELAAGAGTDLERDGLDKARNLAAPCCAS
jgi:hypothetical protein